VYEVNILLTV